MSAPTDKLRELHSIHQRAKSLRDRLAIGPKNLANKQALLAKKQAELETAKKTVVEAKSKAHKLETQLKGMQQKSEELRVKLNSIKKQIEYDAIRNQLAHDNLAQSKLQDEILESMLKADEQAAVVTAQEAEVKKIVDEVDALKADIESKTEEQKSQLATLETELIAAEVFIPEDQREQYHRNVKQRGADAMASAENSACTGCYTSTTAQMINELINGHHIVFCKSCGRILYLADEDRSATKRTGR